MNSGYINEGGQMKTKNGQKYVINSNRSGVYVPRYCIILTALLGLLAMIVIALLSYFLLSQTSHGATLADAKQHRPTDGNNVDDAHRVELSGLLVGGQPRQNDSSSIIINTTESAAWLTPTSSIPATVELDDESGSIITLSPLDDLGELTVTTSTNTIVDESAAAAGIGQWTEGWSPVLYRLVIEPIFEASVSNGSVSIGVEEDTPNSEPGAMPLPIVLDVNNITIVQASVTFNTRPLAIAADYGPRNETYVLRILEPLLYSSAAGDKPQIEVHLQFVSRLGDTLTGFYKTTYHTDGVERVMASTQFSPVDARRAFPCFDRPSKKARFEISVVRHKNFTMALSNMPSIRTSYPRPDYIRDDFDITPRMSTYLVAFVVSNLVNASVDQSLDAPDLPTIRMWTRPHNDQQTQFVYERTQRMLSFLDRYFGIPFGLPKIDLVAVPEFGFHAMENYGLITFRESGLLVASAEESRSVWHTRSVLDTLGHEIAHQWFGNLVTMRWWNDLWLKEGFATYLSHLTLHEIEPTLHVMDYFSNRELQPAMSVDSDESSHPISFAVNSSADIRRMFDPISYSKGASVVAMLNGIVGERAFRAGLRAYLQKYQFGNAEQDDLWQIMTDQAHAHFALPSEMDVKTIMDTWTLQAGYPVVLVQRDEASKTVRLTQQRYLLPNANRNASSSAHRSASASSSWFVPITYESMHARSRDTRPKHWLRPNDGSAGTVLHNAIDGPTDWLYVNVRRIGYYRVNYDHGSWLLLSRNFYDLPALAQAALIDDALALAQAALLTYDVPLTLLLKLARNAEEDGAIGALPWASAVRGVQFVSHMLSRESANGDWRALMKYVLQPMFEQIGFQDVPDDTHVRKAHRVLVVGWACYFGVERCVNRATQLFNAWMADARTVRLSPDLQSTILCSALRHGGPKEWQFVYERYVNHSSASEKEVFLNALGCTTAPWLLSRYLNMTLSGTAGIRKQDGLRAFQAVAYNPVGNELAFDFLSTNIERFSNFFGDGFGLIKDMIGATAVFANLPLHQTNYETFADKAHRLGLNAIETHIRLTLPRVQNNVYWRQTRYYELESYLRSLVGKLKVLA